LKDKIVRLFSILLICTAIIALATAANALVSEQELKSRIEEATKGFKDLTMVGTVVSKNDKALAKVDPSYSRLYEFKTANVSIKMPDKVRMEGKLGMVKFEYIINGGAKIFRAPNVKINKKEDYSNDPAKLQDALDIGLVTSSLWRNRSIEIVDDPDGAASGDIKVRLRYAKGDMQYFAWIDAKNLWVKKFERRDAQGNLKVRIVYSSPQKVGDVIWMPTVAEMYSPDGERAGTSQISDIKINTGVSDTLFQ